MSKLLAELPLRCFSPIFFSVIVYWTVGFNPDPIRFLIFIAIVLVLSFTAGSLGLVIASVAPSGQAAASMGPPILVVAILFGGFYANTDNIPVFINWVQDISLVRWGFQGLMINEFNGVTLTCPKDAMTGAIDATKPCISTGEQVLERFAFDNVEWWECVWPLCVICVFMNVLAFVLLRCTKPRYQQMEPPAALALAAAAVPSVVTKRESESGAGAGAVELAKVEVEMVEEATRKE